MSGYSGVTGATGVAVEKLTHQKMAEKTLRPDALQTPFLIFLYPPNFRCLGGNWTFSTPTGDSAQNP
jgi:hypothetical protein